MAVIRLGVLGGTFNPIHCGHLHLARRIQKLFSLSQVHFVVSATPPHKPLKDLVSFTHRYAMVSLATAGLPSFIPSLVEIEPPDSPFSVDTMRKIAGRFSGRMVILYFIAGGDSMREVKTWRESEELLTSYNFVFAARPGIEAIDPEAVLPANALSRVRNLGGLRGGQLQRLLKADEKTLENRIYIVDVGAPNISATRIRNLACSGKSIQRMVPVAVSEYIRKFHFYGEK